MGLFFNVYLLVWRCPRAILDAVDKGSRAYLLLGYFFPLLSLMEYMRDVGFCSYCMSRTRCAGLLAVSNRCTYNRWNTLLKPD